MKKITIKLALFCMLIIISPLAAAMDDVRLLRFPDISGNLISFVYAGDIWTVSSAGGEARRLTSHEGLELFPKISPDGKWIAFSGEYELYLLENTKGAKPRQVTFNSSAWKYQPVWSPDSRYLIYSDRTLKLKLSPKYRLP